MGDHKSTVTRFPHSNHTIHVEGPYYKVPTFHIRHGENKSFLVTSFPHSYKVWRSISHWQLLGSCIPHKVWGITWVIDRYKAAAFHIRYGDHKSLTVTRFPHLNHIVHEGDPLQDSHIPYKVWGSIWVWQVQGCCIPYKVWGTISHWHL